MRARVRTSTAVMVALVCLIASGCGDDDPDGGNGGTPSADGVVEVLVEQGMEQGMAECMGAAYEAAGFTADDVRDMGTSAPDASSEKYRKFAEQARACTETDISVPAG